LGGKETSPEKTGRERTLRNSTQKILGKNQGSIVTTLGEWPEYNGRRRKLSVGHATKEKKSTRPLDKPYKRKRSKKQAKSYHNR